MLLALTARQISPNFIDDCGSLDPVLRCPAIALELRIAGGTAQTVTILHYGDSPTTADLITGDVRDLLQQRFGDAGARLPAHRQALGLVPAPRSIDLSDHKVGQTSTAVGKGHPEEVYGIGGASFRGRHHRQHPHHPQRPQPNLHRWNSPTKPNPPGASLTVSANEHPNRNLRHHQPRNTPTQPGTPSNSAVRQTKTIDLHPDRRVRPPLRRNPPHRPSAASSTTPSASTEPPPASSRTASTPKPGQTELRQHPASAARHHQLRHQREQLRPPTSTSSTNPPSAPPSPASAPLCPPASLSSSCPPWTEASRAGVDQIETYDTIPRIIAIQRRVAADTQLRLLRHLQRHGRRRHHVPLVHRPPPPGRRRPDPPHATGSCPRRPALRQRPVPAL